MGGSESEFGVVRVGVSLEKSSVKLTVLIFCNNRDRALIRLGLWVRGAAEGGVLLQHARRL